MPAQEHDPFESTRMTLGEHLAELRRRLVRGAAAMAVALVVTWAYYPELTRILMWPMERALEEVDLDQRNKYEELLVAERADDPTVKRSKYFHSDDPADTELRPELTVSRRWSLLGPADGMFAAMKIAIFGAVAIAGPVLLWQMWQFIAAGLYTHERRVVLKHFPVSVALFLIGVLFGYFVLCPVGFYFMVTAYPPEEVQYIAAMGPYLSVLTTITLALGVVFQLPLVMSALARLDLITHEQFVKFWPYFIVAAFVIGGILTPPDPYTQTFMAVPAIALYGLGVFWTRWTKPKREKQAENKSS